MSTINYTYNRLKMHYWNQTEPIGLAFEGVNSGSSVPIYYVARPDDIHRYGSFSGATQETFQENVRKGVEICLEILRSSPTTHQQKLVVEFTGIKPMLGYLQNYMWYQIQTAVMEQTGWLLQQTIYDWVLVVDKKPSALSLPPSSMIQELSFNHGNKKMVKTPWGILFLAKASEGYSGFGVKMWTFLSKHGDFNCTCGSCTLHAIVSRYQSQGYQVTDFRETFFNIGDATHHLS